MQIIRATWLGDDFVRENLTLACYHRKAVMAPKQECNAQPKKNLPKAALSFLPPSIQYPIPNPSLQIPNLQLSYFEFEIQIPDISFSLFQSPLQQSILHLSFPQRSRRAVQIIPCLSNLRIFQSESLSEPYVVIPKCFTAIPGLCD